MTDYQIDCVNRPDRNSPHEHITSVGGPNPNGVGRWKDPVETVVRLIEQQSHRFYTKVGGAQAWVGVRTSSSGRKFLQTYSDGIWRDNLLALKECA